MARLLSVNVGLPRDIVWRGRTVHTGVWKDPVQGRRMARRLNIDGDGQGDLEGHGGEQPRYLSIRSSHIGIGRIDCAEAISPTDNSVRTAWVSG
jgi:MOSC domain-containing protein YiiM